MTTKVGSVIVKPTIAAPPAAMVIADSVTCLLSQHHTQCWWCPQEKERRINTGENRVDPINVKALLVADVAGAQH